MNSLIENIKIKEQLLAIIIKHSFSENGIHFFTPPDLSQQLAYMHHPTGKLIDAHVHNPVPRQVNYAQEVLFIRKEYLPLVIFLGKRVYTYWITMPPTENTELRTKFYDWFHGDFVDIVSHIVKVRKILLEKSLYLSLLVLERSLV